MKALSSEKYEVLESAVREYAEARRLPGQHYTLTPLPASWFNAQRWKDDRSGWRSLDNTTEKGTRSSDFQQVSQIDPEWTKAIMVLAHGLNQRMPPEQIAVYHQLLGDLPIEAVRAGVTRHLSTTQSGFLPSVGVIRSLSIEWMNGAVPESSKAWSLAREAVARFGYLRGSEACQWLPNPVAEAVKRMGFQTLCDMEPDAHTATRARFLECYQQVTSRETLERSCPKFALPGAGAIKYLGSDSFLKDASDVGKDVREVRVGQHGKGPCQDQPVPGPLPIDVGAGGREPLRISVTSPSYLSPPASPEQCAAPGDGGR